MGTQALWCTPGCVAEQSGTGSLSCAVSVIEEFDYDRHASYGPQRKTVPIGPEYQADIPNVIICNGKENGNLEDKAETDRWIRKRIWPQEEDDETSSSFEELSRGHPVLCSCAIHGTIECVSLHIQEKRKDLRNEVGDAFLLWGFNEMGEVVAEHWTAEEQLAFHDFFRTNPVSFGRELLDIFPSKSIADLVSYYFNVFVLRRRAIQNRVDPENVDSDSDEMFLDSEEKGSDSLLGSDDEDDDESQVESQVDDGLCEDEEEDGCIMWSVETNAAIEERLNHSRLFPMETTGQEDISMESSSLRYNLISEHLKPITKALPETCHRADVGQMVKSWEMLSWDQTDHVTEGCVKEIWNSPSLISNHDDVDKLISTNGLMEEFFGAEVWKSRK